MPASNMPAAEVEVDVALVRELVSSQREDLAHDDIRPLAHGWDNFSYLIGRDRVARLPRRALAARLVENEARWLPGLAPHLPLLVPVAEFVGEPSAGYPWSWLIVEFIPGRSAGLAGGFETERCAAQMGEFLAALHEPAPEDAPENPYRGGPLIDRDESTRQRLGLVGDPAMRSRLGSLWDEALDAEPFSGEKVWLHGDLHPQNVLIQDGVVSGVIDFGDITSGDPATDLIVAWNLLGRAQDVFWDAYGSHDEDLILRARGWALSLGLAYLASSADNPVMARIGESTLNAVDRLS